MIDAALSLHPWIGSHPTKYVTCLEKKTYKYNLLSKISFAAIGAITLAVLGVSLFLTTPTTTLSLSLLIPVLATPLFAWSSSQFQAKSLEIQSMIEKEKPVSLAFEKIKHWKDPEILAFLNQHNIPIPPNIYLLDLLPLIARFHARSGQTKESLAESAKLLLSENLPERQLRLWQRNIGWNIRERKIIPAAIESAFVLYILKNPTCQENLSDHFALIQKTFEERQFDRIYDKEDTYLLFLKEKRPAIALETLSKNLDPDALSQLLF